MNQYSRGDAEMALKSKIKKTSAPPRLCGITSTMNPKNFAGQTNELILPLRRRDAEMALKSKPIIQKTLRLRASAG